LVSGFLLLEVTSFHDSLIWAINQRTDDRWYVATYCWKSHPIQS